MARSEAVGPGEERARIFAEIGRICATDLEDAEQGIVAYAHALCESPTTREFAEEIERLAEGQGEPLERGRHHGHRGQQERGAVVERAQRAARVRRALVRAEARPRRHGAARIPADPHDRPRERGGVRGHRAHLPQGAAVAGARGGARRARRRRGRLAARARGTRRGGRDLRAEAQRPGARQGALRAGARRRTRGTCARPTGSGASPSAPATTSRSSPSSSAERSARRGREKADALLKIAEVYEDHLNDLAEATRRYEAVLAIDDGDLQALKGLDRIYNRGGQVPRAARGPRAPGGDRRDAAPEDQPVRAHGGAPRRGVPRSRARRPLPRGDPRPRPGQRPRADDAAAALPRARPSGRSSTSSTRSTRASPATSRAAWSS